MSVVEDTPTTTDTPEQADPVRKLFTYSRWVHVGEDADSCPAVATDASICSNPAHFHAWVRLPNQFQHDRIREKALAAKGRRTRQLRDPSTDAYDALEASLDLLAQAGDAIKDELIDELVRRDTWKHYQEAVGLVNDLEDGTDEDGDPIKPYASIAEDQVRFGELEQMAPEDRPADEWTELQTHVEGYLQRVEAARAEAGRPQREALEAKDISEIVDLVREERIRREANAEFMGVYSKWEWQTCTLRGPHGARVFSDLDELEGVAPEVYAALKDAFDELEANSQEVASGN